MRRFTDRKTAAGRIWEAIQQLQPAASSKKQKAAKQPARHRARQKNSSRVVCEGSRTEQIIALLRQPEGATLEEVMATTGWQAHSVRGFISAVAIKKMGLKVESTRREAHRVYRIQG